VSTSLVIEGFAIKIPIEQTEPTGWVEKIWKPVFVIFNNPALEGAMADALEGEQ